jgi:hypothetical protein
MNNDMQSNMEDQSQPYKEPGIVLKCIGILWGVHVLIASLLFPRFLLPRHHIDDPKNIQKERIFTAFRIFFGTFILFFNILCVFVLFTRSSLIDAAKVLFVLGTWIMVGFIYILFNHLRDVYYLLAVLEDDAIQSRDQSVMLIRAGQTALKAGNLKLYRQAEAEDFSFMALVKKIGPLAILVMQKSNIKDIAIEALKLVLSGSALGKYFF